MRIIGISSKKPQGVEAEGVVGQTRSKQSDREAIEKAKAEAREKAEARKMRNMMSGGVEYS